MRVRVGKLGLFLAGAFAAASLDGADSQSAPLTVDPGRSILWHTAVEWPLRISLDWPEGAATAALTVAKSTGGSETFTISDTSAAVYELTGTMPASDADECILDLAIAYRDADGNEIVEASRTARLGVVCSIGGDAGPVRTRAVGCRAWNRFADRSLCLIPEGATGLTENDVEISPFSAPGWYQLPSLAEGESVRLGLRVGERTVEAEPFQGGFGISLFLR